MTKTAIYPADALLTWLEQQKGGDAELRLPVFVTLKPNKMNIKTATVGDKPDALAIKVNDSTLNIPVAGKVPMFCGEGAESCMLWLQGHWKGGEIKEFQVTKVEGAIADGDRGGPMFAEILKS